MNNHNNQVVADVNVKCLHVYNNSGRNLSTVRLPPGVSPMYFSADPSGGYVIIDVVDGHIDYGDHAMISDIYVQITWEGEETSSRHTTWHTINQYYVWYSESHR